jgi:hypothetical protein
MSLQVIYLSHNLVNLREQGRSEAENSGLGKPLK